MTEINMAEYENRRLTSSREALSAIAVRFIDEYFSFVSPYLFLSRADDDDVRDIGKHDFRSILLHSMLSYDNSLRGTDC